MKLFRYILVAVALCVSVGLSAQSLTVTGRITDSSTGEPVPGAAVQLKDTAKGGIADADGHYSISVPSDAVLVFASLGYQDQMVPVQGRQTINVQMVPDTQLLEETVVVAFGTSTKEAFTGSATVVKSSDIAKVQASEPTRALEGLVAGVQMTTSTGSLGSQPSIIIRGIGTMSASSAPLYVVDGVP